MSTHLPTEPYKGTRDFYPRDMAIQRYIFDTWAKTAESFGFERYDASILEPSELYKSKGAENEEMVNEQTYTFTDRGDREVTLRPEMTPTVARMVAGKRRDLNFPIRWYSIPNLFRYERPQRGRLREHWQLNCDLFGVHDYSADVEMIALAHDVLIAFGAKPTDFEIRINDRAEMRRLYAEIDINDETTQNEITRLNDRYHKMSHDEYVALLSEIQGVKERAAAAKVVALIQSQESSDNNVVKGLQALGIENVKVDRTLARGFDYYTGTIFEIFDTSGENNRSLIGGGRYDNLTGLFGGNPISGVGFGIGDVTMRDFLETHNLLEGRISPTGATLVILPMDATLNIEAEKIAHTFRAVGVRSSVDLSDKKIGKKLGAASDAGAQYILVVGENEITQNRFTLKKLVDGSETTGALTELIEKIKLSELSKVRGSIENFE